MIRLYILAGFSCLFLMMHLNGNLNKYINTKYAYLSESAIVLLGILFVFEFVRLYVLEREANRRKTKELLGVEESDEGQGHDSHADHDHIHHEHEHEHEHVGHAHHHGNEHHHHGHSHAHHDHDHHGHSHDEPIRWKRYLGYGILIFPLITGFFLPVQTLDSSFVKAKGFSFPNFDASADNPGFHQFLKPDTSVFYGKQGYAKVSKEELEEFKQMKDVELNDVNFLKGLESIYNFPTTFTGRTVSFDGFIYKGEQVEGNHYFVFRFGFIHCVADSGVFGMLVNFPTDASFQDDDWVHVTGKLNWTFYQPFKQTIPELTVTEWKAIPKPKDPYVYR
ncbi:TIGR03943 family protein [Paenibacillus sp. OV219]|uniref:TIGR03943 family putative permease subunit n=1 Tax=Paenibacillus sp. OV219 TaxID=1884377 RepID=UPI0008CEBD7F|nr:TIGR03943 family protein [Paenibacillus sp. OV219]SEM90040.1 putative membrane protein [Paenibacillus sp. OV219]